MHAKTRLKFHIKNERISLVGSKGVSQRPFATQMKVQVP